jgi:hypothetical protein
VTNNDNSYGIKKAVIRNPFTILGYLWLGDRQRLID